MALRRVVNGAKPWCMSRFVGTRAINPTLGRRFYCLLPTPPPHVGEPRFQKDGGTVKAPAINLGIPADLNIFLDPDVQEDLVRHVPCEYGDTGPLCAARFALGVLDEELGQGIYLTTLVSADVIQRGWSIYSISFVGCNRKGRSRLYHAHVLHDPASKRYRLFKCGKVDASFPEISEISRHGDTSEGATDSWESKNIVLHPDAIVPVDITIDLSTASMLNNLARSLLDALDSAEDICFEDLISVSKAEIYGGSGVVYFVVLQARVNDDSRCFLALIDSRKLILLRQVDELFGTQVELAV